MPGGAAQPAGPLPLDGFDDPVGPVVVAEPDEDLVEHDLVGDLRTARRQGVREPPGQPAGLLDQLGHPVPTQLPEPGPGREPPGPARGLQGQVGSSRGTTVGAHEVRRGVRHGGGVRLRVRAEGEPAVVGQVEPLVPVTAPRVGTLQAAHQVARARAGGGPQAERTVHVDPRPVAARDLDAGREVVAGAGVHVAGLEAHDRRVLAATRQHPGQVGDVQRTVGIGPDRLHARRAEAQQPQGPVDRGVPLDTGHDPDDGCAGQPVTLHVPARVGQDVVAPGGQAHGVRLLRTGDEADRGGPGDPQQLLEPPARDLLRRGRRRGEHRVERALVPARRDHVGGGRRREGTPDHEPEEPGPGAGHEARLGRRHQLLEHVGRLGRALRQGPTQRLAQRVRTGPGHHRSLPQARAVVGRVLRGREEQRAQVVHDRNGTPDQTPLSRARRGPSVGA